MVKNAQEQCESVALIGNRELAVQIDFVNPDRRAELAGQEAHSEHPIVVGRGKIDPIDAAPEGLKQKRKLAILAAYIEDASAPSLVQDQSIQATEQIFQMNQVAERVIGVPFEPRFRNLALDVRDSFFDMRGLGAKNLHANYSMAVSQVSWIYRRLFARLRNGVLSNFNSP